MCNCGSPAKPLSSKPLKKITNKVSTSTKTTTTTKKLPSTRSVKRVVKK